MTLEVRTIDADSFDPLTLDEAITLTEKIRVSVADLEWKIVQAYYGQAWKVLEYESWDDYVQGEFKQAPLALPREDRKTQVASLRQQGLSLRAIGAVTGTDHKTVQNDLAATGGNSPVQPDRIVGLDGKERPSTRPPSETGTQNDTPPEVREACPTCGQILPVNLRKEG